MANWFLWAGISFILGGVVSSALTMGATEPISFQEDISGYAIGWILVGIVLIVIGFIKRKK
ncbi:MAG: hypothetical protein OEM18_04655 [Nitrosopumilus sp.]|jgi:hypothetical protein|nr:hypothetical protein [Nitrosopumilus sp.]